MSIKSYGYNVNKSVIQGRYTTTGNSFSDIRIDSATDSIQTIDYAHHEIHAGSHYFVRSYQDLSINNVLDFTVQTPNTTSWLHFLWDIQTESETNWLVYEDAVITNALANTITPLNSDRNSLNTSTATFKYEVQANLAAANADTDVTTATLIESGISGIGKSGGNTSRDNEINLKQNTIYCMRAIASSAGYINFHMSFYQHTNRR